MNYFTVYIFKIFAVPVLSPLFIGITRKVKAKFQNREGASVFQPYRDLWKLFHKNEVISGDASWISLYSPYIIFVVTIVVGSNIPLVSNLLEKEATSDLLLVIYLLALGTFFLALAGLDAGGGFGGFGASREMFVSSLAEPGLLLSLVTLALISRTTNLYGISEFVATLPLLGHAAILIAFISFFISFLAETSRYPFDNSATHLELTMIHEAMILEFSGKRLALMEWAAANKYFIFMVLGSNLYFPWGMAISSDARALLTAFAFLIAKIFIFCLSVAVIESTMSKFRIFRLPALLLTSFVLSLVAISLTFI